MLTLVYEHPHQVAGVGTSEPQHLTVVCVQYVSESKSAKYGLLDPQDMTILPGS